MDPQYIDPILLEQAEKAGVTIAPGEWPSEREAVANGLQLHYLEWGSASAPVVLFLHGGAQTAHMWDFSALALRDRYRCIALDQRGHGDSQWAPDGDYSGEKQQKDLEDFIGALGLTRLTLVGLSMGGVNAYVLAANHPDWVERLVIVDIGPESGNEGVSEIRSFVQLPDELDSYEDFVERVRGYQPYRSEEQIRGSLKHNIKQLPSGKWTWKYDRAFRDPERLRERASPEYYWQCLERIGCPTLIVRGAGSRIFPEAVGKRMVETMRNARMITVENAGHRIPGDNPVAFERALADFLDGPKPAA